MDVGRALGGAWECGGTAHRTSGLGWEGQGMGVGMGMDMGMCGWGRSRTVQEGAWRV